MLRVNRLQQRRVWKVIAIVTLAMMSLSLVLFALKENINLYLTPSELMAKRGELEAKKAYRLGGLVVAGSHVISDGLRHEFVLTDGIDSVKVRYRGLLPDLFREKQGIVTQGHLEKNGVFFAEQVLAKHDENYHPPGIPKALT